MRRITCALVSALLLLSLCIPCAAADTGETARREYSGFSDLSPDSPYYSAVKACYEAGLLNGRTETVFDVKSPLSVAQLVVIAARLYSLEQGGDGTVPAPPDSGEPYLRFYDEAGTQIAAFTAEELPGFNIAGDPYIGVSNVVDDPALPETCTLETGYEGYNHLRTFAGVKESHDTVPGVMNQFPKGTGYRFTDPDAALFTKFSTFPLSLEDAWWFPAAFYLSSEGKLTFDGELVWRANPDHNGLVPYDPLTRFSDSASRSLFAWLVDLAAGDLEIRHETVSVPDVDPEETQDAGAILRLYQAGILNGVDGSGRFNGEGTLTRGAAALLLERVLDPGARV